jgi:hypothetical protein
MIALMRFQDDRVVYSPIFLGVVVAIALILGRVLGVSSASPRRAHLDARRPTEATQQRSQAISAVRRSPTPTDPRVREAAEKAARLYLRPYERQGRRQIVICLVLAGFWLATGMPSIIDHSPRQALTPSLLAALFVGAAAWAWHDGRRIKRRLAILTA